jgi:hypothetical protein
MTYEILRVTPTGDFVWHEDADRLIEESDFTNSPSMQHILRALRKQRTWVGLTEEEVDEIYTSVQEEVNKHWDKGGTTMFFPFTLYKALEQTLKDKND